MVDRKMRNLGYGLFICGMMFAVLFAAKPVQQDPAPGVDSSGQFPDTWPLCALGLIGGVVGAGLIRRGRDSEDARVSNKDSLSDQATDASHSVDSPADRLASIAKTIGGLHEVTTDWTTTQPRDAIDQLLTDHVSWFSTSQAALNSRYGMTRGTEILVAVAIGERMLNRAWSASADGYASEASGSMSEARRAFEQAAGLCEEVT